MDNDIRPEKRQMIATLLGDNFDGAEVIWGLDEDTGNRFLVFGTHTFTELGPEGGRLVRQIIVPIRRSTSELEALLAAVQVKRGYHDYPPLAAMLIH
jgi:hypothetical protein